MDTLAFGYILPAAGRIRDLHPLERAPAPTTPPILPLDDIENWRKYVILPDYSQVPHEMIANGIQQAMNLNQDMFVQDFFCCNGIFERLHFWMGFENALIALKIEPEIVYDIAEAIADTKISYIPYADTCFSGI